MTCTTGSDCRQWHYHNSDSRKAPDTQWQVTKQYSSPDVCGLSGHERHDVPDPRAGVTSCVFCTQKQQSSCCALRPACLTTRRYTATSRNRRSHRRLHCVPQLRPCGDFSGVSSHGFIRRCALSSSACHGCRRRWIGMRRPRLSKDKTRLVGMVVVEDERHSDKPLPLPRW